MTSPIDPDGAASAAPFPLKAINAVVRLAGALSTLLILTVLAITLYAVFQRYVLDAPLLWTDEVTGWALVAIVMLGAGEAYRRGDHIGVDLLSARLSGRARTLAAAWADAAVALFSAALAYSCWDAIAFARAFGSYTSGHIEIETWIPQVPILIGCGLMAILAVARIAQRLAGRSAS